MKHKDALCRTIGRLIDATMLEAEEEGAPHGQEQHFSILRQLLDNPELSPVDVKASVTDYITAGVDTIGNSIIFAMALVANNEQVQKRLHEELDAVRRRLSLGGDRKSGN